MIVMTQDYIEKKSFIQSPFFPLLLNAIPILLGLFLITILVDQYKNNFSSNNQAPTYDEVVSKLKERDKKIKDLEKKISEKKIKYNSVNFQDYHIVKVELSDKSSDELTVGKAELCQNSKELNSNELYFENQHTNKPFSVKMHYTTEICESLDIPLIKLNEEDFNKIAQKGEKEVIAVATIIK